jgi:hypothetical protein
LPKPEKDEIPKIRVGQFQGLYFDNVETEYTQDLK